MDPRPTLISFALFSTCSALFIESCQFLPTPPAFGALVGVPFKFYQHDRHQKTSPWAIVWRCYCDPPTFSLGALTLFVGWHEVHPACKKMSGGVLS